MQLAPGIRGPSGAHASGAVGRGLEVARCMVLALAQPAKHSNAKLSESPLENEDIFSVGKGITEPFHDQKHC